MLGVYLPLAPPMGILLSCASSSLLPQVPTDLQSDVTNIAGNMSNVQGM